MTHRDELILEYTPQVDRWVKGFIAKHPDLWDQYPDLLGEANLRLVEVVDSYMDGKIDNFSVYLRLSVMTAMTDYIRANSLIPVRSKSPPSIELNPPETAFAVDHHPDGREVFTVLLQCAKDFKDREILHAKAGGATMAEVMERTGLSRNTIKKRLARIGRLYEKATQ